MVLRIRPWNILLFDFRIKSLDQNFPFFERKISKNKMINAYYIINEHMRKFKKQIHFIL